MNYKLLIVEDEGIIALDLKTNLEKLGYDVVGTADNGEEAIEIAKETHPDIVLTCEILITAVEWTGSVKNFSHI